MTSIQEKPLHDIEEDEFLAGPERYAEWDGTNALLDIDWIFGKGIGTILEDIRKFDPHGLAPDQEAIETEALAAPGYRFRKVDAGVLLLAPDGEIAGGYLGCDVALSPEHQGKGLGAELVLERYLREGDLPTWYLDHAAYSPAGEAAHRAAWRLLQDPAVRAAKRALFEAGQDNH